MKNEGMYLQYTYTFSNLAKIKENSCNIHAHFTKLEK
jgi:hypothetical protein